MTTKWSVTILAIVTKCDIMVHNQDVVMIVFIRWGDAIKQFKNSSYWNKLFSNFKIVIFIQNMLQSIQCAYWKVLYN